MNTTTYYRTLQDPATGRWLVVHDVPGTDMAAIDCTCLTHGAAAREASLMELVRRNAMAQEAVEWQALWRRRAA